MVSGKGREFFKCARGDICRLRADASRCKRYTHSAKHVSSRGEWVFPGGKDKRTREGSLYLRKSLVGNGRCRVQNGLPLGPREWYVTLLKSEVTSRYVTVVMTRNHKCHPSVGWNTLWRQTTFSSRDLVASPCNIRLQNSAITPLHRRHYCGTLATSVHRPPIHLKFLLSGPPPGREQEPCNSARVFWCRRTTCSKSRAPGC